MQRLLTFLGGILWICPIAWGAPLLQLIPPSGTVSGGPGSTVGWGFTLTNNANFVTVSGSDFCEGAILSPCPHAIGTYTDFIGQFNFIVAGPPPESSIVSQTFNQVTKTGVGSFRINPSALNGSVAAGQIVVTYDLFNLSPNDPAFNPALNTISTGNRLLANARVNVTPEPGSWSLSAMAVVALAL